MAEEVPEGCLKVFAILVTLGMIIGGLVKALSGAGS